MIETLDLREDTYNPAQMAQLETAWHIQWHRGNPYEALDTKAQMLALEFNFDRETAASIVDTVYFSRRLETQENQTRLYYGLIFNALPYGNNTNFERVVTLSDQISRIEETKSFDALESAARMTAQRYSLLHNISPVYEKELSRIMKHQWSAAKLIQAALSTEPERQLNRQENLDNAEKIYRLYYTWLNEFHGTI